MEIRRFMSLKRATIRNRLYLIGAAILLVGLLCAAWVYLAAPDDSSDSYIIGYELVNGHKYPITAADSKHYQYQMEQLGGNFMVLSDELARWLSSLWHGQRLAYTIAFLSIVAALVCFWVAQHPDYNLPDNRTEE
jgi:hypothetical protein